MKDSELYKAAKSFINSYEWCAQFSVSKQIQDDFNKLKQALASNEKNITDAGEKTEYSDCGHTPESEMNELSKAELIERLICWQRQSASKDRLIEELKEKVRKLEFMIENGLGPEDMINDITMPHEI